MPTKQVMERYKVHPSLDTVLLFNEEPERPLASVSMADIPTTTLNNIVATNQYLALPRLSSQDLLEGINYPNIIGYIVFLLFDIYYHRDKPEFKKKKTSICSQFGKS